MKYNVLGGTGLRVSQHMLRCAAYGPNQFGLPPEEGGLLIKEGILRGINFLDTAQSHRTYPHIRKALDSLKGRRDDIVIATKSAASSYEDMAAVEEARQALDRK